MAFRRVSESQRQGWRRLIENYLTTRDTLRAVIQIVDLRHPPSKDDIAMLDWLRHYGKARLVLATKADKVPRNQRPAHVKEILKELGIAGLVAPNLEAPMTVDVEPLLVYSAEEGVGREELWPWVIAATRTNPAEQPAER